MMGFRCCVGLVVLVWASMARGEIKVQSFDEERGSRLESLNSQYLVSTPELKDEEAVPLVIYLHGSGGVGQKIEKIRGQVSQVIKGIETFKKGPCLVVAPQATQRPKSGPRAGWLVSDLNVLMEELKARFSVDPNRVYLTGNSMGGYGSWLWGGHSPEHFAAIAPVSGGLGPGGPKDVTPDLEAWAKNLATVPVYAAVGGKDRVVPAERSERMVKAIKDAGGKTAVLKVYPEEGHRVGRLVYESEALYEWMFGQVPNA